MLFAKGLAVQFYPLNEELFMRNVSSHLGLKKLLNTSSQPIPIAVDGTCSEPELLLIKCSEMAYTHGLHHWLIIGKERWDWDLSNVTNASIFECDTTICSYTDVEAVLNPDLLWMQNLDFPLVSRTRVARLSLIKSEIEWEIWRVFRVWKGLPMEVEEAVVWKPGKALFYPPPQRFNFHNVALRSGIVLSEGDKGDWLKKKEKWPIQRNMWTKYDTDLMDLLALRYNFSMQHFTTKSWGYLRNGTFDGLVSMLYNDEIDVGTAGIAMKLSRSFFIQHTSETGTFWPRFLFRQPRLSTVSNVYLLPFSCTVWIVYLGTVFALTAILVATQRILAKWCWDGQDEDDRAPRWYDIPLYACAILCDEGYPQNPSGLSSRVVLLAMLLLSVFLVTSYSACIVSLLQAPSPGYDTLQQLLDGPIRFGMQDVIYNRAYGNETSDPLAKRFYAERLPHRASEAFLSIEEGVACVRAGLFAFHSDFNALRTVADTFLEEEKCGLKLVPMFPRSAVSIPVPRGSPLAEVLGQGLRWIRETGIIQNEFRRWDSPMPQCGPNSASGSFVSVGLAEFRPVIILLAWGIVISLAIFVIEVAFVRFSRLSLRRQERIRRKKIKTRDIVVVQNIEDELRNGKGIGEIVNEERVKNIIDQVHNSDIRKRMKDFK